MLSKLKVSVDRRRQARLLSGTDRAGSWARGRAIATQRAFLRANARPLGIFALAVVVAAGAFVLLVPSAFLRGLLLGATATGVPALMWIQVLAATGTAPAIAGSDAEQWTAEALRRARRHGWRLVNGFGLAGGDIDHVLVGDHEALCVETKWSATAWNSPRGLETLDRAIAQARTNATRLEHWEEFKRLQVEARPVVVLWGPSTRQLANIRPRFERSGATVVLGRALNRYMDDLPPVHVGRTHVDATWAALARHAQARDKLALPGPSPLRDLWLELGWAVAATVMTLAALVVL